MPAWIPSQLMLSFLGMSGCDSGDLLAWDWERLGRQGWEKLTVTLQGRSEHLCHPGSEGQEGASPFLSLNPKPRFILTVLRKPEQEFSVFKPVGISVGMSRHKKAQTFSFMEVSL